MADKNDDDEENGDEDEDSEDITWDPEDSDKEKGAKLAKYFRQRQKAGH
jgi:hypothetical protein